MIIMEAISYRYGDKSEVISNLNYTFEKGTSYLITGENGAGKTTLIKLLLGLLKPTSGCVKRNKKNKIVYLPDHNGLYEDLSIIDNVIFRLSLYKIKFKVKQSQFYELLENYRLAGKEEELVKNLSLGMKKKVGIICALLCEADIYVFDEPTGGLDDESTIDVLDMLNALSQLDVLMICISHEDKLKQGLTGRRLTLKAGKLI